MTGQLLRTELILDGAEFREVLIHWYALGYLRASTNRGAETSGAPIPGDPSFADALPSALSAGNRGGITSPRATPTNVRAAFTGTC